MNISYNWLQSYFAEKLPAPEKLAELFTFRFAEVESMQSVKGDTVFDVKVLPDRASYALCHRGVAGEVSAMTGLVRSIPTLTVPASETNRTIAVSIEESSPCERHTARYIENVSVVPSPAWLTERLEVLGQRSINNIVDATNYVMFDVGQPLHAFDADKLVGGITVRFAKLGETITTLDNKVIALDTSVLVIADDAGPLDIAGVKGGKRAEVDAHTKNIVLESASFDASSIRKASALVHVRTESSKRFENRLTPVWAPLGSDACTALIKTLLPDAKVGALIDVYPHKVEDRTIVFDPALPSRYLGEEASNQKVKDILTALGIGIVEKNHTWELRIPPERLDLILPEDMVEEVGRILGYENIQPVMPPVSSRSVSILKSAYYIEKVRDALVSRGFSEIFTYSFRKSGLIEIEKSLASDKNFLRQDLVENMREALIQNAHYADVIGISDVKIFEIGNIFLKDEEKLSCAIGVRKLKKEKGITDETVLRDIGEVISKTLSVPVDVKIVRGEFGAVFEIDFGVLIAHLPEPKSWNITPYVQKNVTYEPISMYPFVVRDIAIFVPDTVSSEMVLSCITKEAGNLLVRSSLFDTFKKDGKMSYAFRLVFQSFDRTLLDDEINKIMEKMTIALHAHSGWQVR